MISGSILCGQVNDMDDAKKFIGKTVKDLREAKNMTQEDLAGLIGKTAGAVGQIERGDIYPNYDTLSKIIKALDADANRFFSQEKPNYSNLPRWMSDASYGMPDSVREDVGLFLAKISQAMLKESDES
ncbi:MAG: helix-turn-helix domain-containing protein [Peptococcaceae bacterium]|nr:helix-turn-helix domain-containing protein [Peptococcaceae bacterium]